MSQTLKILLIVSLLFQSCELFTTRSPEEPDLPRGTYQAPSLPEIVIENFKYAIIEKNTRNFISCLSDTATGSLSAFVFTPTAEINAIYSSVFSEWSLDSEKRFFNNFINQVEASSNPAFSLNDGKFINDQGADSVVFAGEYRLAFLNAIKSVNEKYSGRLQFTISKNKNGLWSISRWIDINPSVDSTGSTWSSLKARLSN